MFSRLPVERSSAISTSYPFSRNRSATCEPMNPAPPVTRTLANVRGIPFPGVVQSPVFQREQISRGINDGEATTVGRGRFQSHAWLMQEFVHQRSGEMLDDFCLLRRKWPKPTKSCRKLRTTKPVHLIPELADHRNSRQPGDPIPIRLCFLGDDRARGWSVLLPALEIRGCCRAQVVEIVQKYIIESANRGFDVARQCNVENAQRAIALLLQCLPHTFDRHHRLRRSG